jgi:tetratricopeptide (TPR) repeat protein
MTLGVSAERRLNTSVSTWQKDAAAWSALAAARETIEDFSGALEAATTATRLAPASEEAWSYLVTAATAAGRPDLAIEAATELIRMNPSSVEPLLLRAGIRLRQRDWEKAELDCRAALAIHPLHPQARLFLAISRHYQGDVVGGKREAETAAGLASKPQQRNTMLDYYHSATR